MGSDDRVGSSASSDRSGRRCVIDYAWQGCHSMSNAEVVVTGVGLATPLGNDFATFAANLLAGKSAASAISDVQAGVEVRLPSCLTTDPPAPHGFDADAFSGLSRSQRFLIWCTQSALNDAGYGVARDAVKIGLVLGSGGELLRRWEGNWYAG